MARSTPASRAVRLVLIATALLLPSLSLVVLGGLYLWQNGYLLWWAAGALVSVAVITLAQKWLLSGALSAPAKPREESEPLPAGATPPEEQAWSEVRVIADTIDPDQLDSPQAFLDLGRRTIETVARRLHPTKSDPTLQFTTPEVLAITERVSRRLSWFVVTHLPFGDRLTVAQLWSAYRWRGAIEVAERAYDIWRLIRLANPATAIAHETRERLSKAMMKWGKEHVTRRLAAAYVEEVGRAAIDLYGGRLRVVAAGDGEADRRDAPAATVPPPQHLAVLAVMGSPERRASIVNELTAEASAAQGRGGPEGEAGRARPLAISVSYASGEAGSRKALRGLLDEAATADVLVWLLEGAELSEADKALARAIAEHFRVNPRLRPPLVAPVTLGQVRQGGADIGIYFGEVPVRILPTVEIPLGEGSARHAGIIRLHEVITGAAEEALRVGHLRLIAEQQKNARGWGRSTRQAAMASINLARSLAGRRTGK